MNRKLLAFVVGALLMTAAQTTAQTDDDTADTTPDGPVVEALKKKKEIAELEQAIAEAEKATLDAKLPDTEGSGVEGTVTLGESGYFAELLAFQALDDAAARLVSELGGPDATESPKIVIAIDEDFAGTAQLWEIASLRITDANNRLQKLIAEDDPTKEAVGTALLTATAILGAASDIASFFRSDLTVKARDVDLGSTTLAATTAARLTGAGWKPVLPAANLGKTHLMGQIETLLASRQVLADRRTDLETKFQPKLEDLAEVQLAVEAAEAELAGIKAKKGDTSAADAKLLQAKAKRAPLLIEKTRWERGAARIDAALTSTDALVRALVEGVEGKPSVVEAVAAVDIAKSDNEMRILRLAISSQGGEIHVAKGAFTTRLVYVGGVVVSYLLTDQQGHVQRSGVIARSRAESSRAKDAAGRLSRQ
jgi:hypothetical protein